jgi:D-xylose transport system substrate-binding protein
MRVRTMAVLAVPLLVGSALAGCSSSKKTAASSPTSSSPSAASTAASAAPAGTSSAAAPASSAPVANASCKIALLLPENTTPRYEAADRPDFQAEVAAKAPNCKVLYFNAANDGNKQTQQAETALSEGAQVLVLGSADAVSAGTIVQEAAAKGVKTIDYDRMSAGPVAYLITFDALKVGTLQGQALVAAMQKNGAKAGSQVVMINGDTSGPEAVLFKKGATDAITAAGFKVGATYDTVGWSPDTATTEMTQAITKLGKGNFVGVYVANDTMAGAAINAMQQAGIKPLPPVTGQDAAVDGLQRILLGTQTMTIYKALKLEATAAADAAVGVATGQGLPTGTGTATNSTGNSFPEDLLTPITVTTDNMKSTVIADGFVTASALCTADVQAACAKAGIS